MTVKSRTVGHGLPSLPVCSAGMANLPEPIAVLAAWKNAAALQNENWPKIEPWRPLTQCPAVSAPLLRSLRARLVPLKPNQMPTTAPAGSFGVTGFTAACWPASVTSGWYTLIFPVAGSTIDASTKADCALSVSWQAPLALSVVTSWNGVASPCADSGFAGTSRVQSGLGTAAASAAARTTPAPPTRIAGTAMAVTNRDIGRVRDGRAEVAVLGDIVTSRRHRDVCLSLHWSWAGEFIPQRKSPPVPTLDVPVPDN